MGYDLNFWRYKDEQAGGRSPADHLEVYVQLCEGATHPDLELLDLDAVRRRLSAVLADDWVVNDGDAATGAPVLWSPKSGRPVTIEGSLTAQWIRFDLRGNWTGEDANLLIDVMNEFGTPMFDPQVGDHGTRFVL